MLDISTERSPELLRAVCRAYETANGQLVERLHALARRIAELEGIDAAQAALDLPDVALLMEEPASERRERRKNEETQDRPPQRGHGPSPQPRLEVEDHHHVYDEPPPCDLCGGTMEEMAGQSEDAEEITVSEATYRIALHRRQKYRCRCNGQVKTAPGPPKLIPGGRYSVEFAVHVGVGKYCDHLPLERQVRQMERSGLEVSSQTLWDQIDALASHLEPTWEALGQAILAEPVLHVDETGWRMMGAKKPKWAVWGLTSPTLAWYNLASSKSTKAAEKILKDYHGIMVVDGFAVYPKLQSELVDNDLRIAHCWAHVLRKFRDDVKDPPKATDEILTMIGELYKVEREVEGPFPGDSSAQDERRSLREEKSRPLIEDIREWAFSQGGLRRSNFGKAVAYMLNHWDGLTVFLDDPRVPLDNNAAERILRGVVVGRKNYYGTRSKRGAKVASILYTLIETAKLQGVDPRAYLQSAARAAIERPGAVTLPS